MDNTSPDLHIPRFYHDLGSFLAPHKALIVYGPRRVGKTTLLDNFLKKTSLKYRLDSGDNIRIQQLLSSQDFAKIAEYVSDYELIAIDEAQQIPDIGMALKIIVDQHPRVQIIATGSSSFGLAHEVGEPLTGRKRTITLYPVAQKEMRPHTSDYDLRQHLEDYLIFGTYPAVLTSPTKRDKITTLTELVDSYLFKDIFILEKIKRPAVLVQLTQLLAFQIGSEVSCNEIATQLRIDARTVVRYLDLLEKTFVIVRMGALSRNLRNEITHKQKYYFLDTGVRNAVIGQFNSLDMRDDIGKLWENFCVMERLKKQSYEGYYGNRYFWRTYAGQEIDLVEEVEGRLDAYECKWKKGQVKPPRAWTTTYPQASYTVVNQDNYLDFVA